MLFLIHISSMHLRDDNEQMIYVESNNELNKNDLKFIIKENWNQNYWDEESGETLEGFCELINEIEPTTNGKGWFVSRGFFDGRSVFVTLIEPYNFEGRI